MAYFLSPVLNEQQFDANGDPRNGALINTYLAGTLTPVTTYKTSTGTAHTNPIQLNSEGYYPNGTQLWLLGGLAYKLVITDANGANSRTYDDISGIGDNASTADEWVVYNGAPTYISATSFSLVGDQTNTFQISRRIKSTNTGGTVYSSITNSAFAAAVTTVTVVNTSGVLDAGMSVVSYGLLSATNPSVPTIYAKSGANGDITSMTALTAGGLPNASITAPNLSGAQTGTAPIYGARAWVHFNGTGVVAIRASGNVSSITDNGAGDYTVNFTTAMPNANYSLVGTCELAVSNRFATTAPTTSAARIATYVSNTGALTDAAWVSAAIFG